MNFAVCKQSQTSGCKSRNYKVLFFIAYGNQFINIDELKGSEYFCTGLFLSALGLDEITMVAMLKQMQCKWNNAYKDFHLTFNLKNQEITEMIMTN